MRWPLGGRRRGRPVLPTRSPAPPAAPTTRVLPPQRGAAEPGPWPPAGQGAAPRGPAPPPAASAAPTPRVPAPPPARPAPAPPGPTPPTPAAAPVASPAPPPPAPQTAATPPSEPSGGAPPEAAGDDRPATLRDVRSVRRWLVVTAVWAVAATAIAVLAFLTANDDDDAQRAATSTNQVRRADRQLQRRISALETQLAGLAKSQTVVDLGKRVDRMARIAARQDRTISDLSEGAQDIRDRLTTIEQAADEAEQGAGNSAP